MHGSQHCDQTLKLQSQDLLNPAAYDDSPNDDSNEKGVCTSVITGCNPAPVPEPCEHIFDLVYPIPDNSIWWA